MKVESLANPREGPRGKPGSETLYDANENINGNKRFPVGDSFIAIKRASTDRASAVMSSEETGLL